MTLVGAARVSRSLTPSCPYAFQPQVTRSPNKVTHAVCLAPHETAETDVHGAASRARRRRLARRPTKTPPARASPSPRRARTRSAARPAVRLGSTRTRRPPPWTRAPTCARRPPRRRARNTRPARRRVSDRKRPRRFRARVGRTSPTRTSTRARRRPPGAEPAATCVIFTSLGIVPSELSREPRRRDERRETRAAAELAAHRGMAAGVRDEQEVLVPGGEVTRGASRASYEYLVCFRAADASAAYSGPRRRSPCGARDGPREDFPGATPRRGREPPTNARRRFVLFYCPSPARTKRRSRTPQTRDARDPHRAVADRPPPRPPRGTHGTHPRSTRRRPRTSPRRSPSRRGTRRRGRVFPRRLRPRFGKHDVNVHARRSAPHGVVVAAPGQVPALKPLHVTHRIASRRTRGCGRARAVAVATRDGLGT